MQVQAVPIFFTGPQCKMYNYNDIYLQCIAVRHIEMACIRDHTFLLNVWCKECWEYKERTVHVLTDFKTKLFEWETIFIH